MKELEGPHCRRDPERLPDKVPEMLPEKLGAGGPGRGILDGLEGQGGGRPYVASANKWRWRNKAILTHWYLLSSDYCKWPVC